LTSIRKIKVGGQNYYLDGYMKQNLDLAKQLVKKDFDMILIYDGYEGSGKSVKVMQDAFYCDPTLTLDRVTFNPNEFRKAIIEAKPYQAVIYDEAYTGLSSRAAMSRINRALVTMLAEIRQKNLFVFVVVPTFFDVDRYVALWRSRALIHIYTGKKFQRGYFMFYSMDRKKQLYVEGKKYYSYFKPRPNFSGRFTNYYVLNEKDYRKKKKEALIKREKAREEIELQREIQTELFRRLAENEDIPHKTKIEILGIPEATYWYELRKFKEEKGMYG